jgi:hypothetical protein
VDVLSYARRVYRRAMDFFPIHGFYFDRPIILLQSDDWGRVGLRDEEGFDCLRSAGLNLGERPYDLYTLETADDLGTLASVLNRHHDSTGCSASIGMNFIVANLDFAKMEADAFRKIHLLPLAEGLPQGWSRSGLLEAYHAGVASGVFCPALHGLTHFCRAAVERALSDDGDHASLLRTLWRADTPYIHWRMPWIGYEYWDPEKSADERFLPSASQQQLIGQAVGMFTKLFSTLPRSACAPGYRANDDTHRAWSRYGVRVAQNGPGSLTPPHMDRHGLLHLYRTVELEPATDSSLSIESCVDKAETCFASGIPAIVSIHSINFHSSVGGFRDRSLKTLDQFLSALEARHSNLLYLCDEDIYQLVETGSYETSMGIMRVNVTRKKFTRRHIVPSQKAG